MTMIDKVADAIQKAEFGNNWDDMARAAIAAMRVPTPQMLKACGKIIGGGWMNSHSDQETWETMIDEALVEKPAPEPVANDFITIHEHCVRKLRRMRVTGESSTDINAMVSKMECVLGIDVAKVRQESLDPGSIEGYPFTAAEEAKAKEAGLIP